MRILVSGSKGYVGSRLVPFLEAKGHRVTALERKPGEGITWQPDKGEIDLKAIEGFDAFINLSGENVGSGRWIEKKRQKIRDSRVLSSLTLAKAIKSLKEPPSVWVDISAVGYYATQTDRICDESAVKGQGFLSDVCMEKEQATLPAEEFGVRVVNLRLGLVLSRDGGVLQRMLIPFRLCLGGVMGSGKQYISWIAMEDLLDAILFCVDNPTLRGPVNAVSPNPVTNREFTKTLGKVLWRPTLFWMPTKLVKLIFGEMGQELFLSSVRAIPQKLLAAGFKFKIPNLKDALKKRPV